MNKISTVLLILFFICCNTLKRIDTKIPEYLPQNDPRLKYTIKRITWGEDADFMNKIGYFTLQIEIQNNSEEYEPAGYRLVDKSERRVSESEIQAIGKDPRYTEKPEYWKRISPELKGQRVCEVEIQVVFSPVQTFQKNEKAFNIEINEQYAGPVGWNICKVTFSKESKLFYKYAIK